MSVSTIHGDIGEVLRLPFRVRFIPLLTIGKGLIGFFLSSSIIEVCSSAKTLGKIPAGPTGGNDTAFSSDLGLSFVCGVLGGGIGSRQTGDPLLKLFLGEFSYGVPGGATILPAPDTVLVGLGVYTLS